MELENLKQQAQSELAPTTTLLEDVCGWMVTNFSLVFILLLTTRINIVPPFFFLPSVLPFLRNVLLLLLFFFFPSKSHHTHFLAISLKPTNQHTHHPSLLFTLLIYSYLRFVRPFPPSPFKLYLVKSSFYPFMKIHETIFIQVLHTIDHS